jgi:hypothetical protein
MICVLNKLRGIRKPNNLIFFGRKKLKGLNRIAIFSKTSTVKKQNYMNMNNTTNSISSDISTQKYQMRSVAPARKYCSAVCPILIVICKYYVHLNIPRARTTYSDIHIYVLIHVHWYQNATLLIVNLKHNNGKCTHAVTHDEL